MELPTIANRRKPFPVRLGQGISRPEIEIPTQVLIEKFAAVRVAEADVYAALPPGEGVREQGLSVLIVDEIAHPFVVAAKRSGMSSKSEAEPEVALNRVLGRCRPSGRNDDIRGPAEREAFQGVVKLMHIVGGAFQGK